MIISLIAFIIVLSVIVFVHEFGHYYAAIKCGVRVEIFSIGFGKVLCSYFDARGTKWQVCGVPLGGFVKMYGERGANVFENQSLSFQAQSLYKRILIVIAGPMANYLLAITILTGFYYTFGLQFTQAVVANVEKDSPAYHAGLQVDDKILAVGDIHISSFAELKQVIASHPNQLLVLSLERRNKLISLNITPKLSDENMGFIGVVAPKDSQIIDLDMLDSIAQSCGDVVMISRLVLKSLWEIITGTRSIKQIGGMISVAHESGKSIKEGPAELLLFIAFISINIGLINLIPIPMLDGGYLLLMIYEALVGRKITIQAERIYYKLGVLSIIFLVVISTSNDIKSFLL
jgi:regulator of sigma E protease